MADSIVQFLLEKLADQTVTEVLSSYIDGGQVKSVQNQLITIKDCSKDLLKMAKHDEKMWEKVKNWPSIVRTVAYMIEDLVDECLIKHYNIVDDEERPKTQQSIKRLLLKLRRPSRKANNCSIFGEDLNQIRERFRVVDEAITEIWEITQDGPDVIRDIITLQPRRISLITDPLTHSDDNEIIGFTRDGECIVRQLLDQNTPRRAVVSIVGTAGIGKTTLASIVFNSDDIIRGFDVRIWLPISEKLDLSDILSRVLMHIQLDDLIEQEQTEEHIFIQIRKSLGSKKYLIVLDDVRDEDTVLHLINGALPDSGNNGSRVLVTSRFLDVAKMADPQSEPYKLQLLTDNDSLHLLLKTALPCDYPDGIPADLNRIGKLLVKKCGGLPLALVKLGRFLSTEEPTPDAWARVLETKSWDFDGRMYEGDIIDGSMRFDGLPDYLKPFFMYLAAFPENYEICARSLIRIWVAEGFVPIKDHAITLEDTAQQCLEDLAQRSMIQVSGRSVDGSITYFRLHPALHGTAIEKSKEDNFVSVSLDRNNIQYSRRVAIHHSDNNELIANKREMFRTLLCFNYPFPNLLRPFLLKVLSCMGGNMEGEMKFEKLAKMARLRYLEISWFGDLSKVLAGKKYLQTIDLRQGDHGDLPDYVWQVKTLRHVLLKGYSSGPTSAADLVNLQTLTRIKNRESWETGLPNMPGLRELDIQLCQGSKWSVIATLLAKMKHLISLNIVGNEITSRVINMRKFPFYKHLQSLSLREHKPFYSSSEMRLNDNMFPVNLGQLILENLRLKQDPMLVLQKHVHLKILRLGYRSFEGENMRCSAGGFVKLRELEFFVLEKLREWEIEDGTMPELQKLTISCCPLLSVPQGMRDYLRNLQELSWSLHHEPAKEDEIRSIFQHDFPNSIRDLSREKENKDGED